MNSVPPHKVKNRSMILETDLSASEDGVRVQSTPTILVFVDNNLKRCDWVFYWDVGNMRSVWGRAAHLCWCLSEDQKQQRICWFSGQQLEPVRKIMPCHRPVISATETPSGVRRFVTRWSHHLVWRWVQHQPHLIGFLCHETCLGFIDNMSQYCFKSLNKDLDQNFIMIFKKADGSLVVSAEWTLVGFWDES